MSSPLLTQAQINRALAYLTKRMPSTFFKAPIVLQSEAGLDRWQESGKTKNTIYTYLQGLHSYNYFKQWQINVDSIAGTLDKNSEAVIFEIQHLKDKGLILEDGSALFDAGTDRIYVNGSWYKNVGETYLSQLTEKPIYYMVVLQKDTLYTTKPPSPPSENLPVDPQVQSTNLAVFIGSPKIITNIFININSEILLNNEIN